MTSIKTLPLLEGTRLIVLDEGMDAMYSRKLIAGWIQMYRNRDPNRTFEILLFSDPKLTHESEQDPFAWTNVNVHDCYTVDINCADINLISEKDCNNIERLADIIDPKSTVIIDCLSSLILYVGLSKAIWLLERLNKRVAQLFCIYRHDFVQNIMPCIETLGSTYVNIEKFNGARMNTNFYYMVEFVHRKVGGGILKQKELVNQNSASYELQSEKVEQNKKPEPVCENHKEKVESSFRIEINETEMKQRNETVLPYTINTNTTNTSKIYYQPEAVDDFDEEDPDDDLCF